MAMFGDLLGGNQRQEKNNAKRAQQTALAQQNEIAAQQRAERDRIMLPIFTQLETDIQETPAWVEGQYNAQRVAARDAQRLGDGGLFTSLARRGMIDSGLHGNAMATSQYKLGQQLQANRANLDQQAEQRRISLMQLLAGYAPGSAQVSGNYSNIFQQQGNMRDYFQGEQQNQLASLQRMGEAAGKVVTKMFMPQPDSSSGVADIPSKAGMI